MPVATVATVLEAPPLRVFGARAYERGPDGLKSVSQVLGKELDKDLSRVFPLPKKKLESGETFEKNIEALEDIRLLVHTQPRAVPSLPSKKPEVMELSVEGATPQEKLENAKALLGKEVKVSDIFYTRPSEEACVTTACNKDASSSNSKPTSDRKHQLRIHAGGIK
jgi:large subunit ribosomal protein L3